MNFAVAPNEVHEAKIEGMMEQYATDLLRMCCLYLKNAHLAEDAVQDFRQTPSRMHIKPTTFSVATFHAQSELPTLVCVNG